MSKHLKIFVTSLLTVFLSQNFVFAQIRDSTLIGEVTGLLRDSTHHYALQSATVTIYKSQNNELVGYQLTNNFGRFRFKSIPINTPLRVIATLIGYDAALKDFIIPPSSNMSNLDTINLQRSNISLKEVTIVAQVPPVQMRGDTIEFNADAFKLDTNAVVEDMLRKLPGVTIWNDGLITVNGKKINKLFVEGKEFFGGVSKIALQNLAKNAVQKVQVYQDKRAPDLMDPATDMNIVLKKHKKDGYFGKLGGGYGSSKHNDVDGMISYFSPKTQLSVVGAVNDVNKTADNVNALISLNSYKGEGIDNDYYSDFTKRGTNVFKALGVNAQQDFSTSKSDTSILKTNYFFNNAIQDFVENDKTFINLNSSEQVEQKTSRNYKNSNNSHKVNIDYNNGNSKSSIIASYYFQRDQYNASDLQKNSSFDSFKLEKSQNDFLQNSTKTQNIDGGSIKFITHRYKDLEQNRMKSLNLYVGYFFDFKKANELDKRVLDFTTTDTSQDKTINRQYALNSTNGKQTIVGNMDDIMDILQNTPYLKVDFKNTLSFDDYKNDNTITDLVANSNTYIINKDLTNKSHNRIIDYKPGLNFSKKFTHSLDSRYSKSWNISLFAVTDFYNQKNASQMDFQNIRRSYFYLTPASSIVYSYTQFGGSRQSYSLNYQTSVNYPTIFQLAPLIDDADIYNITYGNRNLKPAYNHKFSFRYDYDNGAAENSFYGNVNFIIGSVTNFIADSSYFDAIGRNTHKPINVSVYKYASLNGYFQKAYKFNNHQLQFSGNFIFNYADYPSNINGSFYLTKTDYFNLSADATYTYKGLTTNFGETFLNNKIVQENLSQIMFYTWRTYTNAVYTFPKGFFCATRFDMNYSKSSYTDSRDYTIWNVDVGYRFLKGANAEVKVSALDLLHQNSSVINYVNNNRITSGSINVLQQYFMVTLAYYPRRFGLAKK